MGATLSTRSQADATHKQLKPASDAPESVSPNIVFTSPHFLPAPSNILVIESYSSMGGPSLGYALLYSPHVGSGGIAIASSGRMCNVPPRRWEEMENLVRRAKEVSEQLRQSSWSRPQTGSCPTSVYYDLGPSEKDSELYGLHRTAHQVSTEDLMNEIISMPLPVLKHPEIRTSTKLADGSFEETTLKEIPEPIRALEIGLHELLRKELFPGDSESVPMVEDPEAKAMVAAIKNLCGSIGYEKRRKEIWRQHMRKKTDGFRWW